MFKHFVLTIFALCLPIAARAESPKITRDVVYGHKDGLAMTFDVIQPKDANGVGLLFMVSGGWFSKWFPPEFVIRRDATQQNAFEAVVDRGFTLFLVRHGSAPKYKVPDAVADVRRAVRYVRLNSKQFEVDPDRLGVFGGSAGGHLSLMLGTTSDEGSPTSIDRVATASCRVACVVAQFPPTDLRQLIGPSESFPALDFDSKLGESVSPILHVTDDDAPTLLVHGDQDRLVPLSHSENIVKAFEDKNVDHKLIVIQGAAHGFHGDDEQRAIKAMVEWFETHLLSDELAASQ